MESEAQPVLAVFKFPTYAPDWKGRTWVKGQLSVSFSHERMHAEFYWFALDGSGETHSGNVWSMDSPRPGLYPPPPEGTKLVAFRTNAPCDVVDPDRKQHVGYIALGCCMKVYKTFAMPEDHANNFLRSSDGEQQEEQR